MPATVTHGDARDGQVAPEYRAWAEMKARCYRRTHAHYACYGGRGIRVCDVWRESYEAFLGDVGRRPARGYSLDRLDNNGHYEPGNCRWATQIEQVRNRRCTVYLTAFGRTQCLTAWAAEVGLLDTTLGMRLRAGWDVERALSLPARRAHRAG
jgi:hypothetical protein